MPEAGATGRGQLFNLLVWRRGIEEAQFAIQSFEGLLVPVDLVEGIEAMGNERFRFGINPGEMPLVQPIKVAHPGAALDEPGFRIKAAERQKQVIRYQTFPGLGYRLQSSANYDISTGLWQEINHQADRGILVIEATQVHENLFTNLGNEGLGALEPGFSNPRF